MIFKILLQLNLRRICGAIKKKDKRKLRSYKEMINPNLEDQNYLFILTSVNKKINIATIRTNSHQLHGGTRHWTIPKTLWDERICHLFYTKRVEDEKHFLLDCLVSTQIRSQFQNICHTTNVVNLLNHQNYGDLGILLLMLYECRDKILKNPSNPLPFLRFDRPNFLSIKIAHHYCSHHKYDYLKSDLVDLDIEI
jgi:hypothetical protein